MGVRHNTEGSDDGVVAMALTGILATEVTPEENELATGDVHAYPLAHVFEVLEEGGGVLAGGEGGSGIAGDLFGEGARIAVVSEVR